MNAIGSLAIFFLLCFPTNAREPIVVAHRGASRDAPENTIPAFRLAWRQGADAIEGDFHLTKDGKIVCIHDGNTKKVTTRNLVVSTSTLADLKVLDVGAYQGKKFRGTSIPTIAEVFATIPKDKRIYVEVKCGVEIVPSLLSEIRKSNLEAKQILVISFKKQVIKELKTKAPEFKAFWLCGFEKDKSGRMAPSQKSVMSTLAEIGADGLSSNSNTPGALVKAIKNKGYEWHVWTINDFETAKRMKALGAQSITTDIPGRMRKELMKKSTGGEVPHAVPVK